MSSGAGAGAYLVFLLSGVHGVWVDGMMGWNDGMEWMGWMGWHGSCDGIIALMTGILDVMFTEADNVYFAKTLKIDICFTPILTLFP